MPVQLVHGGSVPSDRPVSFGVVGNCEDVLELQVVVVIVGCEGQLKPRLGKKLIFEYSGCVQTNPSVASLTSVTADYFEQSGTNCHGVLRKGASEFVCPFF